MKLIRTARIKLTNSYFLKDTIIAYTQAFNYVTSLGFSQKDFNGISLHHKTYQYCRQTFGLPSQLTISSRMKAVETLKSIRALQKKGKKVSCPISKRSSIRLDHNSYSINLKTLQISILTLNGREKFSLKIPNYCEPYFQDWKYGSAELKLDNKNKLWLNITFTKEIEDPKSLPNGKIIGVDRGLKKLAVTSDNQFFGGGKVKQKKKQIQKLRSNLQVVGTKSAKRHLKRLSLKEKRFMTDINHVISKQIVSRLQTGDTIVLEKLTGIRTRANRFRKQQKADINSWAFKQLESFISYKAEAKGIKIEFIDARYTSQKCGCCGYTARNNRKNQSLFACKKCGYRLNADLNAARNICYKSELFDLNGLQNATSNSEQAEVSRPIVEAFSEVICKPTNLVVG